MQSLSWQDPDKAGAFLLDASLLLLRSGASSQRVLLNIRRMAEAWQWQAHVAIMPLAVSISLHDAAGKVQYNGTGNIQAQGVNFQVLSGISQLSWAVAEQQQMLEDAAVELERLAALPHYNRWLLLVAVSLAGAAFCFTFGGGGAEMAIGFAATFAGLFCKQEMVRRAYNAYIITYMSALVAGCFVGLMHLALPNIRLDHAFATCVLFLIPGVPLINAVTDLIDGYTLNGVARGISALMHAMAIALGLATVLYLFQFI